MSDVPVMPSFSSLVSRIEWLQVSKAFLRSQKMSRVFFGVKCMSDMIEDE